MSAPPLPASPTPAPKQAEQKCNYCGGTGRWTKDIIPGKPAENVYCPHCHGSGQLGHSPAEDLEPDPSA